MQYLLLIHGCEASWERKSEEELKEIVARYGRLAEEMSEKGVLLSANRLHPVATATTVRIRDGELVTTDGPFAETKEQLGGYFLIEASDLDEAIDWAKRFPGAEYGAIEVRPVWTG